MKVVPSNRLVTWKSYCLLLQGSSGCHHRLWCLHFFRFLAQIFSLSLQISQFSEMDLHWALQWALNFWISTGSSNFPLHSYSFCSFRPWLHRQQVKSAHTSFMYHIYSSKCDQKKHKSFYFITPILIQHYTGDHSQSNKIKRF